MAEEETSSVPQTLGWGPSSRSVSDSTLGSFTSSSEQLALSSFAHQLYSVSTSNDPGIAEENDVRQEAKLLMSLACVTPNSISVQSGRVSPPSDASTHTTSSKRTRDSFRFACPSLSLEVHSEEVDLQKTNFTLSLPTFSQNHTDNAPATLLGRVLQVDDRDALRLSSEAMARNVMQSYEKAVQWRIKSWVDSLSGILVEKEKELHSQGLATEENIRLLCESSEAMLILGLRHIGADITVVDACNNFKVLAQRAPEPEPKIKKQRSFEDQSAEPGLEETEYEYTVSHLLCFECNLNIHAPAIGNASINFQVPGTIQGTFVSLQDGSEHLAGVVIDVNTDILASMIEKSSRIVVRSSVEALLQVEQGDEAPRDEQEIVHEAEIDNGSKSEESSSQEDEEDFPPSSYTPKRKLSDERVAGLIVITPRESSSPSSFEDSDNDDRPLILSIPHIFSSDQPKTKLHPQPSRTHGFDEMSSFATRLPAMKKVKTSPPTVVTPSKTVQNFVEGKGPGPNLPILLEAALQLTR